LVVFDWDDTLFPTTHLHPVDESEYANLIKKYARHLTAIEDRVVNLLETCLKQAKVVIITNARKGWVEFSSKKFLPRVYQIIMKYVTIVSARVLYEQIDPYNTYLWK
jgi:nucleoside-triphosphatase THEP1